MIVRVKIHKRINNDTPLKAIVSVSFDDAFVIHDIKLIKTDKSEFLDMPSHTVKDKNGSDVRRDVVHPLKPEIRKALTKAVVEAYELDTDQYIAVI